MLWKRRLPWGCATVKTSRGCWLRHRCFRGECWAPSPPSVEWGGASSLFCEIAVQWNFDFGISPSWQGSDNSPAQNSIKEHMNMTEFRANGDPQSQNFNLTFLPNSGFTATGSQNTHSSCWRAKSCWFGQIRFENWEFPINTDCWTQANHVASFFLQETSETLRHAEKTPRSKCQRVQTLLTKM